LEIFQGVPTFSLSLNASPRKVTILRQKRRKNKKNRFRQRLFPILFALIDLTG